MNFFRFQQINKLTIQNLIKEMNWVADPYDFNDPFEFSMLDGFRMLPNGFKKMSPAELANINKFRTQLSAFGVVCYCGQFNSVLLWSHYADSHKGMCFVFGVDDENQKLLHKIDYQVGFPDVNFMDDANTNNEIKKIVTTKLIDWKYECEFRQVFEFKNSHYEYPGELKEIIFGCRTTLNDMEMVTKIVRSYNPDITISKMIIDQFTYGLNRVSIQKDEDIPNIWSKVIRF